MDGKLISGAYLCWKVSHKSVYLSRDDRLSPGFPLAVPRGSEERQPA